MRYKDYVWPHNPRVYSIEYERSMGAWKVPFGRYQLQDLGPGHRVMRGEGEFVGEGAYEEFKRLATVFYSEGPGSPGPTMCATPSPSGRGTTATARELR